MSGARRSRMRWWRRCGMRSARRAVHKTLRVVQGKQRERLRIALTLSLAEEADRGRRQFVQEGRLNRVPSRQLQHQRNESERRQERAVRNVLVPSMRRYAPVPAYENFVLISFCGTAAPSISA